MPDPAPHEPWMRRALSLAERGGGATSPNPMVGCVLLDASGTAIGEGWHARAGGPHAEVVALDAAREAGRDPAGGTAVVTLEPCAHRGRTPACAAALVEAGVARVVYAAGDPAAGKGGADRLRAAGVETVGGVLAGEAERLNEAWLAWAATGRPFVHAKVAHTLSGHVSRGTGEARWITGPEARAAVHRLRRRLPAALVGIGTALADDPRLTVREWPPGAGSADDAAPDRPWPDVQPLRVVLDSDLRLPPEAALARSASEAPVLVLCGEAASEDRRAALADRGVEIERIGAGEGGLDLRAALDALARREVAGVLVEPGPTLAAALLAAGLVDRWTAHLAPDTRVGDDAVALFAPEGPVRPFGLDDVEVDRLGDDVAISGRPRPA